MIYWGFLWLQYFTMIKVTPKVVDTRETAPFSDFDNAQKPPQVGAQFLLKSAVAVWAVQAAKSARPPPPCPPDATGSGADSWLLGEDLQEHSLGCFPSRVPFLGPVQRESRKKPPSFCGLHPTVGNHPNVRTSQKHAVGQVRPCFNYVATFQTYNTIPNENP